jgi:Streptogramin lyase
MVTMDKDGHIWQAMMGQAEIAELDPKTGKVSTYLAPIGKRTTRGSP